jgi:hypothetical protein
MHIGIIFNKTECVEVLMESKTIHDGMPNIAFTEGGAAAAINNKQRHSPDYSNEDRIPHERFQDT